MKKIFIFGLFAAIFCITVSFWWHFSGQMLFAGNLGSTSISIGRLFGMIATLLVLLQFILIGRVKWVEKVFGLDKLSRIHGLNGKIAFLLIAAHVFLITTGYKLINESSYLGQFTDFLLNWEDVLKAVLGFLILIFTVGLSVSIARKRLKYETWYYVHVFNYLFILLIYGHQFENSTALISPAFKLFWYFLYGAVALNMLWFRFISPLLKFRKHRFTVARVEKEGPATSIYITGQKMDEFKIDAGQFMIFRFLQKGFWKQAHPFSLSQAPRDNEVRLTAKGLGDFTNELPNIKPGTQVIIDGPHGIFTRKLAEPKKPLLFIAGGIGITPIFSMLEDMKQDNHNTVLLYSNKTREETVFGDELKTLSEQNGFKLINILSNEEVPGYEHGMLNKEAIAKLVPDVASREVFLCGPPPMMTALKSALVELGVDKHHIHFERFAL